MKRSNSMQILVMAGFVAIASSQKIIAVEITSWELTTGVQSFFFPPGSQDFDDVLSLSNPLVTSSLSSLNNGLDRCQADYDYSWISEYAVADLNTTFLQAIRTPETRTIASATIIFWATEDLVARIDSLIHYSHTPGDQAIIDYRVTLTDLTAGGGFIADFDGGNGTGEPSASDFAIDDAEVLLISGHQYRFRYNLSADNFSDIAFPPTGIIDTSGFLNISISPVPEPTTLLCLVMVFPFIRHRRTF